ncbi:MAG TPA: hypothetical protein VGE21_06290 [Flavobacteriales bacterium]
MMDAFLDWFERHKFGVVGTLMLHTFLMFSFAMGKLHSVTEKPVEETLELQLAEPAELPDQELVESPQMQATEVKNLSSNSAAETSPAQASMSRGAQERISQSVEEDLLNFEKAEFDRLAAERTARGEDVVIPQLDTTKWAKERYMAPKRQAVKVEGNVTVEFKQLSPTRYNEYVKVPAYLCTGSGRVVVRITLDRDGRVQKTELDASASTTDACMIEHAVASAEGAKFATGDQEKGLVIYTYVGQ